MHAVTTAELPNTPTTYIHTKYVIYTCYIYIHMPRTPLYNIRMYTHIHTYYNFISTSLNMHTYIHTYIHAQATITTLPLQHTYMHTYIHTHIHTYTRRLQTLHLHYNSIHTCIHIYIHAQATNTTAPLQQHIDSLSQSMQAALPTNVRRSGQPSSQRRCVGWF
jgi:hypothetical protein